MTAVEKNCAALRAFLEAPPGDPEAVEKYIHPDIVLPDDMAVGKGGMERVKDRYKMLNAAIRARTTIQDIFGEGDKVAARLVIKGKQVGDFMGVPNRGRSFSVDEVLIAQFLDGKMIQNWRVVDTHLLLRQLSGTADSDH